MLHMPAPPYDDGASDAGDGTTGTTIDGRRQGDVYVDPVDLRTAELAAHDEGQDVEQP
ncbi:MAG: hypothetical protein QOI42_1020, partial [Frankiaceae bacterium]|nr:hypothetical protein [Frankiaceae bacterium]